VDKVASVPAVAATSIAWGSPTGSGLSMCTVEGPPEEQQHLQSILQAPRAGESKEGAFFGAAGEHRQEGGVEGGGAGTAGGAAEHEARRLC